MMSALDVLTSLTDTLIRSEVRSAADRSALERGIVQSVRELGFSLNEVSASTGYTVDQITDLLDRPVPMDDLADLLGPR
jgi:lambda repressor-like predicted transcriptional regulator